ncbi:MAG: hypothetical protein EZS28_038302, partial [Streblomastix strix]
LTGLAYCPVCKLHAVKVNDKLGNWNRDLRRHIEQCKLNKGKQVMLSGNQIPFAPHIIEQWLDALFAEAQQVKEDNMYDDIDAPYDILVPDLGFNSAHFDMIFVLPYLTSYKWHITNYLGDFSHIKRVEVRHKITGIRIQFLDAEICDLEMFNYLSMASGANATKYQHWNKKVSNYNTQDTNAGRDIQDNVNQADFEYFRDIIKGGQCWFCEVRFTNKNPTTIDRIDNNLGHSKNNVQLTCSQYNVKRGI